MKREELVEWRRQRLSMLARDYGGAVRLGEAIGHSSGAQISGMIAGHRQLTEKTIFAIEALPGLQGYFTGRDSAKPLAVSELLSGLMQILEEFSEADRTTARYALHYLVDHPERLDEVSRTIAALRRSGRTDRSPGTSLPE